jgi:hypothetical protein
MQRKSLFPTPLQQSLFLWEVVLCQKIEEDGTTEKNVEILLVEDK